MARRIIEAGESQKPQWEKFDWVVDGARITGFLSVIEEVGMVKKVRLAIGIPADALVTYYGSRTRHPIDWSKATGKPMWDAEAEEMIEVSWYSPSLKVGKMVSIPRELTEGSTANEGFVRIQIVEVSLYSYTNDRPHIDRLV